MVKALHANEWALKGRIVELNFSAPLVPSNQIDGDINLTESITPIVFTTDSQTTLGLLADELVTNLRVEEAVVTTNKITVTGLGKNITFDNFIVTLGASQATITQNELQVGEAVVSPPIATKRDRGYLTPEKPNDGETNWLEKTTYNLINAVKAGDIGGAIDPHDTVASLEAVDGTGLSTKSFFYVKDFGLYQHRSISDIADGEAIIEPADSTGRFVMVAPDPSAIWAYLAPELAAIGYELTDTLTGLFSFDYGSIGAGGVLHNNFTLAGAKPGDEVTIGLPGTLADGVIGSAKVISNDTVRLTLYNSTGGAIDPPLLDYKLTVRRYI